MRFGRFLICFRSVRFVIYFAVSVRTVRFGYLFSVVAVPVRAVPVRAVHGLHQEVRARFCRDMKPLCSLELRTSCRRVLPGSLSPKSDGSCFFRI